MIGKLLSFVFASLLFSAAGFAAEPTLSFDGEVIRRPEDSKSLNLKVDTATPTLDSMLYLRSDFNDFHAVDREQRLRLEPVE